MSGEKTVLALDIGGTKMLAALVRGETVADSLTLPTPKGEGGPAEWLEALFAEIAGQGARLPAERRYAARARNKARGYVEIAQSLYDDLKAL